MVGATDCTDCQPVYLFCVFYVREPKVWSTINSTLAGSRATGLKGRRVLVSPGGEEGIKLTNKGYIRCVGWL